MKMRRHKKRVRAKVAQRRRFSLRNITRLLRRSNHILSKAWNFTPLPPAQKVTVRVGLPAVYWRRTQCDMERPNLAPRALGQLVEMDGTVEQVEALLS